MRVLTNIHGSIRLRDAPDHLTLDLPDFTSIIEAHKQDMREKTGRYLAACEAAIMKPVDVRIKRYLFMISDYLPLNNIMIGQEPYSQKILPPIASAFAFDPDTVDSFTPSVQVLGQMLSLGDESRLQEVMDVMTCSYSLITRGIACVNVLPVNFASN